MFKQDGFRISHRLYAVDLGSLKVEMQGGRANGSEFSCSRVTAVWFRRRRRRGNGPMLTVACIGHLRDLQDGVPGSVEEFLERNDDGRYGGACAGRWDGSGYWGAEEPEVRDEHMRVLVPMLERYPDVPAGFDGWWRF